MKIKKSDLTPIIIIAGINLFTVLLLLVSPLNYVYGNIELSFNYVLLNIFSLVFGYLVSIVVLSKFTYRYIKIYNFKNETYLFKYLLYIFIITFILRYSFIIKYPFYDLTSIMTEISLGISSPQYGYQSMINSTRSQPYPWSLYVILSTLHTLFFISGVLLWKKIPKSYKFIFGLSVFMECLFWYSRGTNFGIIGLLTLFAMAYLVNVQRLKVKSYIYFSILFCLVILIFSFVMTGRIGDSSITDLSTVAPPYTTINYDSYLLKISPDFTHPFIILIFAYLTQGYYYLSFGFDLEYKFSFFLNQNPEIFNIGKIFGLDFSDHSMVNRLAGVGIDPRVQWHSAYLWLASDYSFFFTPLYISILGFALGSSWILATRYQDYVFKIMFVILSGSAFFLFANNNFIAQYFYTIIFIIILSFLKILNLRETNKAY